MLKDDGTKVDPVSGNEVPSGSMASEVRDDIDAKLSEGEYVIPADVVRYLGLGQIEKLVNKAKEGLMEMEDNGRIGGEKPEELEDDLPFSDEELAYDDMEEEDEDEMEIQMAKGGMASTTPYTLPTGIGGIETKVYINADGSKRSIMFSNGIPMQQIPEGYVEDTEANRKTFETAKEVAEKKTEEKAKKDYEIEGGRTADEMAADTPEVDWSNEQEVAFAAKAAPIAGQVIGGMLGLGPLGRMASTKGMRDALGKQGYTAQEIDSLMGTTDRKGPLGILSNVFGKKDVSPDISSMSESEIADVYGSNVARDIGLARSGKASFSEQDVAESLDPFAYSEDYLADFTSTPTEETPSVTAEEESDSGADSGDYGGGGSDAFGGGGYFNKGGLATKRKSKPKTKNARKGKGIMATR